MSFIIIYITTENETEANKIAKHLIEKRLIACTNMFPIKSIYWWKGKIENADEIVLIAKTKKENWQKVKSEVKAIHSYETPCIMKIEVDANEDYESWLKGEVKEE